MTRRKEREEGEERDGWKERQEGWNEPISFPGFYFFCGSGLFLCVNSSTPVRR